MGSQAGVSTIKSCEGACNPPTYLVIFVIWSCTIWTDDINQRMHPRVVYISWKPRVILLRFIEESATPIACLCPGWCCIAQNNCKQDNGQVRGAEDFQPCTGGLFPASFPFVFYLNFLILYSSINT